MKTVFIANRGEIAARVMRSCQDLGLTTLWPYTQEDRLSPAAALADVLIELDSAADYLKADKLIALAREHGADALHPGYGYLSENAAFAEALAQAGIIFVGPSAEAIRIMGDKLLARKTMQEAGVPVVPGTTELNDPAARLKEVGLPALLKPAAGGGGKGMRVIQSADDIVEAVDSCKRESFKAFGSDVIYMERYIPVARHVEVQIMADSHGTVRAYGTRDCSLQRRHQKVIEECPAPGLSDEVNAALQQEAINAAKAVNYCGAGTVEFIVTTDQEFFFLEMNTRLQVEHPVTEMVYQRDLVAEQLAVAQGQKLDNFPLTTPQGHSFEARVYAEDPTNSYFPCTGTVSHLHLPSGPGIRVDSSLVEGSTVGLNFDPMLLKIIATGTDRDSARRRLKSALEEFVLQGVGHNGGFLLKILETDTFKEAQLTTTWLEQQDDLTTSGTPQPEHWAGLVQSGNLHAPASTGTGPRPSSFLTEAPFFLKGNS